jgi:hypothetical protein
LWGKYDSLKGIYEGANKKRVTPLSKRVDPKREKINDDYLNALETKSQNQLKVEDETESSSCHPKCILPKVAKKMIKIQLPKCVVYLTEAEVHNLLLQDINLYKTALARGKAFSRSSQKREQYQNKLAATESQTLNNHLH